VVGEHGDTPESQEPERPREIAGTVPWQTPEERAWRENRDHAAWLRHVASQERRKAVGKAALWIALMVAGSALTSATNWILDLAKAWLTTIQGGR
jgi:hypothetical protein